MGGTSIDWGNGIAADASNAVYITGSFHLTADFDPGAGTANLTSAGSSDIFVSKLDSAGNFVWAKRMGGTGNDQSNGIAVDASGNVYTTGWFGGTVDFDPGAGTANLTSEGGRDIFVSKLDSAGEFVWATSMAGPEQDWGSGIAVDSSGNVYTTGKFVGTVDFDPGAGTANLTSAGEADIFVSKLDSAGDFLWAKAMGGTNLDKGNDIAVDASGAVYTTGYFEGMADFDPGAATANLSSVGGSRDIFVSKLDSAGNFVWAASAGGTNSDWGSGIAVDSSDAVCTIGNFQGTVDFDPGAGTANLSSVGGGQDIFVSKLDSAGNFVWATSTGGTNTDRGYGIAVDSADAVYTTGYFWDTVDFDPGADTANLTSAGSRDIFVSKLDSAGNFVWAKSFGGTDSDYGIVIAVDASGSVYTTGWFDGTADFDPGAGTANLTSSGDIDIFVSKLAVVAAESPGNGDCFIATAAYGTPLAEEVGALRGVRDAYLLTNVFGTAFTDTYYRVSPPIADIVRKSAGLQAVVRAVLAPIVFLCRLLLIAPLLTSLVATVLVAVILRGMGKRLRLARLRRRSPVAEAGFVSSNG